jgi:hypothetical protein
VWLAAQPITMSALISNTYAGSINAEVCTKLVVSVRAECKAS